MDVASFYKRPQDCSRLDQVRWLRSIVSVYRENRCLIRVNLQRTFCLPGGAKPLPRHRTINSDSTTFQGFHGYCLHAPLHPDFL
jgi:hypothetical protein